MEINGTQTLKEDLWRKLFFVENKMNIVHSLCANELNYRSWRMNLELDKNKDYVNNLCFEKNDILIIAIESGWIVLFSVSKNLPISIIKSDKWVSSVMLDGRNIWSVGKDRQIVKQDIVTGFKKFHLQETKSIAYYEDGIILQRTHKPEQFIANTGFYSFKLLNRKTNKVLRKVDLRKLLELNHTIDSIKEFSTSKKDNTFMFVSISEETIYLLEIFDYLTMKTMIELCVYRNGNREKTKVESYHLMVSNDEEIILLLFQVLNRVTQDLNTHFTIVLKKKSPTKGTIYSLKKSGQISDIPDQITTKAFIDYEVRSSQYWYFVVGSYNGFTQTFSINKKGFEIELVEILSKSEQMITQHLVKRNISLSASVNGDIVITETHDLMKLKLGPSYLPISEDKFIVPLEKYDKERSEGERSQMKFVQHKK